MLPAGSLRTPVRFCRGLHHRTFVPAAAYYYSGRAPGLLGTWSAIRGWV